MTNRLSQEIEVWKLKAAETYCRELGYSAQESLNKAEIYVQILQGSGDEEKEIKSIDPSSVVWK